MKSRRLFIVALACTTFSMLGCGNGLPPTYPVTGTVTLDGKPVEGANVVFKSAIDSNSASAMTDANGKYSLTTLSKGDGARVGSYSIIVTKFNNPDAKNPPPVATSMEEGMRANAEAQMKAKKAGLVVSTNAIAKKFESEETSGLKFTVEAKPNSFDIAVTSK
ncbi:MAG TPA: carboxypeptidase-like regulatory domain-containing protein [Pirellula sp.]|nr:carboxypeptidase-like regulatory domain-containing protein [Pirellula sp.]